MNGILLFIVLIYLLHALLKRCSVPILTSDYWTKLQKAMRTRDYLFRKVVLHSPFEERLRPRLIQLIKQGRVTLPELEWLDAIQKNVSRQQGELKTLLNTYLTHLSFVLLTPLVFRLALKKSWIFDWTDFPELAVAIIGLAILSRILATVWPKSGLTEEAPLFDFILAALGDTSCGIWQDKITNLQRETWVTGLDSTLEVKSLLRDWQLDQLAAFDRRITLLEDLLGPMELLTTCFFGTTLLGLPLLSHFSGLVIG